MIAYTFKDECNPPRRYIKSAWYLEPSIADTYSCRNTPLSKAPRTPDKQFFCLFAGFNCDIDSSSWLHDLSDNSTFQHEDFRCPPYPERTPRASSTIVLARE